MAAHRVLRNEWGFDGVVISDWFGCHSAAASVGAGLDVEMPGPPIVRGDKLVAAVQAGEASEADVDRSVERILQLAEWVGAAGSDTSETTATDDGTRDVIRRAAVEATVLLKNEGDVLPLASATTRIALIGPNARDGQPQGGGSAAVRPDHGVGPYDALTRRGFDVTLETGGRIAKYVTPFAGSWDVTFFDEHGHSMDATASRTKWFWDQPPSPQDRDWEFDGPGFGARIRGSFAPDASGEWEVGAHAVGAATLRVDGEPLIDIPIGEHGGAFYGLGSREHRVRVDVEAGRSYAIEVDYPVVPDQLVRGLSFGARVVESGDPLERAAAAAASADVAVVVVGTSDEFETEGEDRTTLALPGDQDALVAAVAAANPNTVVVLNCGSPVTMPWLGEVPAVLQLWFPGQAMGDALADVLTGDAEPGGRLPITFPRDLAETPAARYYPGTGGRAVYGEGLLIGYRWYDRNDIDPLFPFGFGLGYTTFTIEPVGVSGDPSAAVAVAADVTNTGRRAGSEVVQVYVEPPDDDAARPLRHLAAFRRVRLEPGETERVDIEVPPRSFRRWIDGAWITPPGAYRVLVGRSSRSIAAAGAVAVD